MTKAQQQLKRNRFAFSNYVVKVKIRVSLSYKPRRGLYNKLLKLNRFAFSNYVVKVKIRVSLSYSIRNGIKDETDACLKLRVH